MPSPVVLARNELGAATRARDPRRIDEARANLAATKLESYISQIVADAPPLSNTQRDRIAALLRPAQGGGSE